MLPDRTKSMLPAGHMHPPLTPITYSSLSPSLSLSPPRPRHPVTPSRVGPELILITHFSFTPLPPTGRARNSTDSHSNIRDHVLLISYTCLCGLWDQIFSSPVLTSYSSEKLNILFTCADALHLCEINYSLSLCGRVTCCTVTKM